MGEVNAKRPARPAGVAPPGGSGGHYRPDIDGLRALAVVPVVLFHAQVAPFSGGFVGVDVFFVISGFLITSIIVRELEMGRFSVVRFYERRIRRIFPALFTTIALSGIGAVALFMPHELAEFGESVVASTFFVSNIFFWQEVDYFDTPAELKPLLHTWSLAIEEQYYIIFPLILLVVATFFRSRWSLFVVPVFLVSLALSVWGTYNFPEATFYLASSRAWELMLGSILALGIVRPPTRRIFRELWAVVGLGLIVWAILALTRQTPYPGFYALAPCLGAALLIAAGQSGTSIVNRVLALRPLVLVGLISYSLYLLHWPFLVFAKYYLIRPLTGAEKLSIILATLVLSYLSWRFIEQPFRKKSIVARPKPLFASAALAMSLCAVAGVVITLTGGLPARLPPEVAKVADAKTYLHPYRYCHDRSAEQVGAGDTCIIGIKDKAPTFAIWGDSHADMHVPALAGAAKRAGVSGLVMTHGGCTVGLGVRRANRRKDRCPSFNEAVARVIERRPSIRQVFLAGYWRRYSTSATWNETGLYYLDGQSAEASPRETTQVFKRSLARIMERLAGRKIYIITDVAEVRVNLPNVTARRLYFGHPVDRSATIPAAYYIDAQETANGVFDELKARFGIEVLAVNDILCRAGQCRLFDNGKLVYKNGDHLSEYGALLLASKFERVLVAGKSVPAPESR